MDSYEIDVAACRARQQRLAGEMQRLGLELAIVTQHEHVQWLTGTYVPRTFQPAAALYADGHLVLVVPPKDELRSPAADRISTYEAQWLSTMRNDQRQASSESLLKALAARPAARRIGVEFSTYGLHLARGLDAETIDIEPELLRMRRQKDADELALLKQAIAGTAAMYARAREIIEPGVNELFVFNELQAAAVRECGEMLTGTGNDYRCGEKGGPPRDRRAESGELYILDLGPAFRGYYADNARTIAVNRRPTDEQFQAWEHIVRVFQIVERTVKPGKSCRELFEVCDEHLRHSKLGEFGHHLGHGIGLFPHEAPHLNPNWDDTFQAGEVFTVEPGLYSDALRQGIRLENDYLVTDSGVEMLTDFELAL